MKRVFISQKMHGLSNADILKARNNAIKNIRNHYGTEEVEILNTFLYDDVPEDAGRLWYLGRSIQMLDKADVIYFCKHSLEANGCNVEYLTARMYGISIIWE